MVMASMVMTKPGKFMFQQCAGSEAATDGKSSLGFGVEVMEFVH